MIRRSTLIVLLLFVALLAVVFYLQRSDTMQEAEATPSEENPLLFSLDSEITSLRLEHVGSGVVEIEKDQDGIWQLVWPQAEATDIAAVEAGISQLLSLRIVSALGQELGLAEAGLSPPVYRVLIRLADGSQELMAVGKETPTGSGYYVQVTNRGMFVISKFSLDPFLRLVDQPPFQPTATAQPEGELVPSEIPTAAP